MSVVNTEYFMSVIMLSIVILKLSIIFLSVIILNDHRISNVMSVGTLYSMHHFDECNYAEYC